MPILILCKVFVNYKLDKVYDYSAVHRLCFRGTKRKKKLKICIFSTVTKNTLCCSRFISSQRKDKKREGWTEFCLNYIRSQVSCYELH